MCTIYYVEIGLCIEEAAEHEWTKRILEDITHNREQGAPIISCVMQTEKGDKSNRFLMIKKL